MGQCERKAISMALVDRALRWKELGESYQNVPTQNEEFVYRTVITYNPQVSLSTSNFLITLIFNLS